MPLRKTILKCTAASKNKIRKSTVEELKTHLRELLNIEVESQYQEMADIMTESSCIVNMSIAHLWTWKEGKEWFDGTIIS